MRAQVKATIGGYIEQGDRLQIADGSLIFSPGDATSAFLIVTKGAVRVEQTNSAGRTIVLYRVQAGESCVLTTSCLISNRPYSGFGYAEGAVEAAAIPLPRFRALLHSDPQFQDLVFAGFADRVGELTNVIDELLEHRTDLRLARWLAQKTGPEIVMTQQDIAQELGTAREVVSRALRVFETKGWVEVGRGSVRIVDAQALAMLAL